MKVIDLSRIQSKEELHKYLKNEFIFPDYYGNNLDALFDMLTDISLETIIMLTGYEENTFLDKKYLKKIVETFIDASKENKYIFIVIDDLKYLLQNLLHTNDNFACECASRLCYLSDKSNAFYPYILDVFDLLSKKNSFVRNRALSIIAHNAKWDENDTIKNSFDKYLDLLNDNNAITVRVCISNLYYVLESLPELINKTGSKLKEINYEKYNESITTLIKNDIKQIKENFKIVNTGDNI